MKDLYVLLTTENGVIDLIETDYGKIVLSKKEASEELKLCKKNYPSLNATIKKLSDVDKGTVK